jgi:hypothetical protein
MSVSVKVDLHHAQIRNFLYAPHGPVVRGVRGWSEQVRDLAVARAPKVTGELAASSVVEMSTRPGFVVGVITFRARHALWVHEGTGIFGPRRRAIRARGGGLLKFRSGSGRLSGSQRLSGRFNGGYTYTRSVRGQPGKPFLVWALRWVMVPKGARIRTFKVR